jgi:hypothetical protein
MREVLSEIRGLISERAIVRGMKSEKRNYEFSTAEVKCTVSITENGVRTHFRVYSDYFNDYPNALFTTDSFSELREWLEEHKMELE